MEHLPGPPGAAVQREQARSVTETTEVRDCPPSASAGTARSHRTSAGATNRSPG
ncbi:hypothetical protein [Amycolatopsis sulphurea]|uniref:hypothetical protein n=1 Tax=Amycolatopsis sulphurea TaxID=76022 RepID=UPI0014763E11|nr:hypothetical protein [Amycolatopsis sulphurea]